MMDKTKRQGEQGTASTLLMPMPACLQSSLNAAVRELECKRCSNHRSTHLLTINKFKRLSSESGSLVSQPRMAASKLY